MHFIWLILFAFAQAAPKDCSSQASQITSSSRVVVVIQALPPSSIGVSTLIYRGSKMDASNVTPAPPEIKVAPEFYWNEKDGVGMILSPYGAPHDTLRKMLPEDTEILGGTRYLSFGTTGSWLRINSTTFDVLKGLEIEQTYFDVQLPGPVVTE